MEATDDFDLEEFVGAPSRDYVERQISNRDLAHEIALHEASHFVLNILIEKLELKFDPVKEMIVNPGVNGENRVSGLTSPFYHIADKQLMEQKTYSWYMENKRRAISKILSSLAGFASAKTLPNNSEYFINRYLETDDPLQLKYYRLSALNSLDPPPTDFVTVDDFLKMVRCQRDFWTLKKMIIDDLVEFLQDPSIKPVVGYVKNQLLKNRGKLIRGKRLKKIKLEARRLLNKVTITPFLDKYEPLIVPKPT